VVEQPPGAPFVIAGGPEANPAVGRTALCYNIAAKPKSEAGRAKWDSELAGDAGVIEAIGLTKRYDDGGIVAVDDLNLAIQPGELFGFLGPNGAGKTTTIKMLVGLLTPTAGVARVAGFDITKNPGDAKQQIGYIPDNPFLYEKLTGREFLDFIADLYGMPPGKERLGAIDRSLELFDMTARADSLIGSYSRGMRQKMATTAALLHSPKALFLDEPTVGLDPSSIRRLKDVLRDLCHTHNTAVFLSTHTLEVAAEICDRVGIFNKGRLVAEGSPAELTAQATSGSLEDVFLQVTGSIEDEEFTAPG
jgi:ABC-2 type transport system ATP-binding protein